VREGDIKTITLVNKDMKQLSDSTFAYVEYLGCSARNGCNKSKCNWKGRISVLKDKPLNLCNIECYGNHDPEYIRKKPLRMSNSVRKTITNKVANITPSMLTTAQPTSTRFASNLESIQNALKYNKKFYHPSISEFEKVCTLMDNYEAEGT
ncbi:7438_t:CDS:2, partial [Cetraspora pellucida]